jgi:hypothetical protein
MIFDSFWAENEYGFDQQLIASKGVLQSCDVAEILRTVLPGCLSAHEADKESDKSGVDWIACMASGRKVGVDVKHRTKDCMAYGNDDLALETWSVVDKKVGWTRDERKTCEWVLWVWADTGRFCLMPFLPLCAVFREKWQDWRIIYQPETQKTLATKSRQGWKSECVFVPRNVVIEEVTQWCNSTISMTSAHV